MFENFRERLQTVQHDLSTGIKTLGDKSKDSKVKRRARFEENLPKFSAGLELLSRYEENWVLFHKRTKDSAETAEAVDGDIVMLSAHWEQRKTALTQLQEQLQTLPGFVKELETVTNRIAHLEGDFEEMESKLAYLETLCFQCERQRFKKNHINQLEKYKKNKRRELEAVKVELDSEHAHVMAELEQATQQKLKERQKIYEEAFNQDLEQYVSTGYLTLREARESQICALDQVTVTDISDQEALDNFLNSMDDDVSTTSSLTSGPDIESWSTESPESSTSHAPPTDDPLANQDALSGWEPQVASKETGEPLVQSDEEDVHADTSLVALSEFCQARSSDESDSVGSQADFIY